MTDPADLDPDDWSPADNPYAIAVSEAGWWLRTVRLTLSRLDADEDLMLPYSSRQIDARTLVLALHQLLSTERLEQAALKSLGIDAAVGVQLAAAREDFLDAVPGLVEMRHALVHFDEWSRGMGRDSQKARADAGEALRDIASSYWGFRFDPQARTVTSGPHTFDVGSAERAALGFVDAIYAAARQVDQARRVEP